MGLSKLIVSRFSFFFPANTRVIKQSSLQKFQEEMGAIQKDPYRVVMKRSRLPMSLLHDRVKAHVSRTGINLFLLYFKGRIISVGVFCGLPSPRAHPPCDMNYILLWQHRHVKPSEI